MARFEGSGMVETRAMTCQSDVAPLHRVVLKHAREAFLSDDAIETQWRELDYLDRPDLACAIEEYDRFVELLHGMGIEIEFLPTDARTGLDSIYVRDASIASDRGIVLCSMSKAARRQEPT
ncbi:MAG: arginine deiminase-related protein [Planctomycetota bacterium]